MGSVSFYRRLDVFPLVKENRYLAFVLCRRNRFRPVGFTSGFPFGANIEMLVKSAIRRNEKTRLMPRNNDLIASFRPHNRVSFPGWDHDQVAGPMAMPLFVSARWKNRHMGRDGRTGKTHPNHVAAT